MAIDEQEHEHLRSELAQVIDDSAVTTLMAMLPPPGSGRVATTGDLEQLEARIDARFERIDARFEQLDERLDARFERMEGRFEKVDGRIDHVLGHQEHLRAAFDRRVTEYLRWTLLTVVVSYFVVAGTILGGVHLLQG